MVEDRKYAIYYGGKKLRSQQTFPWASQQVCLVLKESHYGEAMIGRVLIYWNMSSYKNSLSRYETIFVVS